MALTKEEVRLLAELMRKVQFPVTVEVFLAWCNNFITNPVELAVLNKATWDKPVDEREILLIYRKDEQYDGWHMPGSVTLPGNKVADVVDRLQKKEIGAPVSQLEFVDWFEFMKGTAANENVRGQELSLLFRCYVSDKPIHGEFFKLGALPENVLGHHRIMIARLREWLVQPCALLDPKSTEWTTEQSAIAVAVLKKIALCQRTVKNRPPLTGVVFEALLQAKYNVSFEGVVFNSKGQLYLVKRPSREEKPSEAYPNCWHTTGATYGLESTEEARQRLIDKELDNPVFVKEFELVDERESFDEQRGFYLLRIHWAIVDGEIKNPRGRFFDVDKVPWDQLVKSHREIILPKAIDARRDYEYIRQGGRW